MLDRFRESVKDFSSDVRSKVTEKELTEEELDPLLEELRLKLLQSNVSLDAVEDIQEKLREELLGEEVPRREVESRVQDTVKEVLIDILDDEFDLDARLENADEPPVVFLVGFNGSGKTTTASKLAKHLGDTVLGAGDTFRAASIEQLEEHGERLGLEVVSHEYESDPAAVGYDTVEHAEKEGKIAIIDTAGRSHADRNLMDELEKMVDVNDPDVSFLVVDALSGNDVVEQVRAYKGMFDAVIVTKMDVDEKGGAIISVAKETDKPIAFLGTGQGYDDLEKFDKESFIEDILG